MTAAPMVVAPLAANPLVSTPLVATPAAAAPVPGTPMAAAPMEPVPMEAGPAEAFPSAADAAMGEPQGPGELPPLKVSFYELLIRQLQDDGLTGEAQSLSQRLHVQPNAAVAQDALFEAYGKSLKWAFGDEPVGEWTPLQCTPVPPLGAQEHVLDLGTAGAAASGTAAAGAVVHVPGPGSMPALEPPTQGVTTRRAPEIRLLYTAQHQQACPCRAAAFSTDGRFCATGFLDGSIKILDCARMRACAVSTDGPLARMRITEEELMKPIVRTLHDHVLGITCLAFHPMNPTLFSGSADKAVKIFDLTRPPGHKKAFSVLQDVHVVRSLSIHPCGDFLLVGTAHRAVRLYDLQTLNCFTTFNQHEHHASGINDLRCTSDGRAFASASSDGCIQLWDAVTQRSVNRLPKAHSGAAVTSLRWNRSLRYLLSSGADGRHRLWDMRMGKELFCMGFGARTCEFSTAVFAAGERYVASANSNTRLSDVSLFDAQTGSPVFMKLGMHNMPVHALEASPIDRTLLTGCDDHKARFFSVEDRGG